jgi:hypothetical protein
MGRATFEGPVMVGDSRYPPFRNVGFVELVQAANIDLAVQTTATQYYSGGSTVFVNGSTINNIPVTVYQPSSTTYPSLVQAIPADTATNVYRGCVMYLPIGSGVNDFFVDVGVLAAVAGGTAAITSQTFYISNNYTTAGGTPTYAQTGAMAAVGRQALNAFTATQLQNQDASSTDILNAAGTPSLSQVVFTLAIVGTNLDTRTSLTGRFYLTARYSQPDNFVGSATAYPYGNLG